MKIIASIAWTSALVSTLLICAAPVNAADSEKPSSPHLRRRAVSGNGTSGWTSPPDDLRSGNSTAGEPLYRVWVEFKPSATHSAALKSVQSTIVANLGAPPDVAAKMLVAERDSDSDAKSSSKKYAFTMHYDFYDTDVQSMVMTMSSKALRAMRKDPNVLRVEMDPKRFAFDAINGERNHEENRRLQEQIRQQGEVVPTGVAMTKANQVWAKGYTGRGVKVCVIDSGLDGTHKEFPISSWVGFSTNVGSVSLSYSRSRELTTR
jgi:subtilisin family serine protease